MASRKKQQWMTGPVFSIDDVINDPTSPADGSINTAMTKRTRASKPKQVSSTDILYSTPNSGFEIRFLCGTGQSFLGLSCDETKPACERCTSTGRKCDGYDGQAPPRRKRTTKKKSPADDPALFESGSSYRSSSSSIATPPNTQRTEPNISPAPQTLRPLAADVEGTEQERRQFHEFRRHAEAALAAPESPAAAASLGGPGFWQRLMPQLGRSDPAVRHTLVALGASYRGAQLRSAAERDRSPYENHYHHQNPQSPYSPYPDPNDGSGSADQLEIFAAQQYDLALCYFQAHVPHGNPEVALVCCLLFVCYETSRGSDAGALTQVANGLQIIRAMPPELLREGSDGGNGPAAAASAALRISRHDWRRLLDFFLALESSVAAYETPTPQCPSVVMWTPNMDYFGVIPAFWETETTDVVSWP
ncbi:hypothetical protein GGR52DRAFT_571015 [Hypoxylon sp. FL1284]|nr:hypothetical protein GGR52DRAFT_571015 [Hypoxylon sp. FL1284]